ncbi:MAG: cysteine rich repeat-containing protein [Tardiphaga sp.]
MRGFSAVVVVLTMTASLPALAYTQADVDACTPDAMRLCTQAMPDKTRVVLCLVKNKEQLSSACTAVFNRARAANASRGRPVHEIKF